MPWGRNRLSSFLCSTHRNTMLFVVFVVNQKRFIQFQRSTISEGDVLRTPFNISQMENQCKTSPTNYIAWMTAKVLIFKGKHDNGKMPQATLKRKGTGNGTVSQSLSHNGLLIPLSLHHIYSMWTHLGGQGAASGLSCHRTCYTRWSRAARTRPPAPTQERWSTPPCSRRTAASPPREVGQAAKQGGSQRALRSTQSAEEMLELGRQAEKESRVEETSYRADRHRNHENYFSLRDKCHHEAVMI